MLKIASLRSILIPLMVALMVPPPVSLAAPDPSAAAQTARPQLWRARPTSKVRLAWLSRSSRTPAEIELIADIVYTGDPEASRKQRLDLFLPEHGAEKAPVVVWIHGGAWRAGDKQWGPFRALTSHGYAVASINYRLSKQAAFPAQLQDCKKAVAWIREHADEYGLDAGRIGVWGASAGGHLAALLGTTGGVPSLDPKGEISTSTKVQAVCDWYGPADLSDVVGRRRRSFAVRAVALLLGGNLTKKTALEASPVHYVSPDDAPFLIMHGDRDKRVPVDQSAKLYEALRKNGVQATLLIAEGKGHGLDDTHHDEVLKFFDKYLRF